MRGEAVADVPQYGVLSATGAAAAAAGCASPPAHLVSPPPPLPPRQSPLPLSPAGLGRRGRPCMLGRSSACKAAPFACE